MSRLITSTIVTVTALGIGLASAVIAAEQAAEEISPSSEGVLEQPAARDDPSTLGAPSRTYPEEGALEQPGASETPGTLGAPAQTQQSAPSQDLQRGSAEDAVELANQLIGQNLTNVAGTEIGDIEDVAIGPDESVYAIVSVGGFFGFGGSDIPVNISELDIRDDSVVLISETSTDELREREEYDPSLYRSVTK